MSSPFKTTLPSNFKFPAHRRTELVPTTTLTLDVKPTARLSRKWFTDRYRFDEVEIGPDRFFRFFREIFEALFIGCGCEHQHFFAAVSGRRADLHAAGATPVTACRWEI